MPSQLKMFAIRFKSGLWFCGFKGMSENKVAQRVNRIDDALIVSRLGTAEKTSKYLVERYGEACEVVEALPTISYRSGRSVREYRSNE